MDISDVSYPPGSVLSVEKVANTLLPSLANGFDGYGNHTLQALEYLTERFGPVASFTGASKADGWMLTLNRHPQDPGTYTHRVIDVKHYLRINFYLMITLSLSTFSLLRMFTNGDASGCFTGFLSR